MDPDSNDEERQRSEEFRRLMQCDEEIANPTCLAELNIGPRDLKPLQQRFEDAFYSIQDDHERWCSLVAFIGTHLKPANCCKDTPRKSMNGSRR